DRPESEYAAPGRDPHVRGRQEIRRPAKGLAQADRAEARRAKVCEVMEFIGDAATRVCEGSAGLPALPSQTRVAASPDLPHFSAISWLLSRSKPTLVTR